MPTIAYDPHLLREQETTLEKIGKDCLLNRWFPQNLRLVTGMGRTSGLNENHHDGRSDHMPGPRTRMNNHYWGMELSEKS